MTWLLHLAADPCPGVRRAVAVGLAGRDDPRSAPALARLAGDAEPDVGAAARAALRGRRGDSAP